MYARKCLLNLGKNDESLWHLSLDLLLFLCSEDHLQGLAKWNQLLERYGVSSDFGTDSGEKGGYPGKMGSCEKVEGQGAPVLDRG